MNLEKLGKRVRGQREKKNLTQAQLANSLYISAQAVSKWERGENAPDISLLKPLSAILDCSIEWLLTGSEEKENTFEATIFCSSLRNFASRSSKSSPESIALWINGIFHSMTEAVLAQNGVPVKYTGDGFLAYFSGDNQQKRAIEAALTSAEVISEPDLLLTVHSGPIYLGAIGHHEYRSPDIMGESVNKVFLMNRWGTDNSEARILISSEVASLGKVAIEKKNVIRRTIDNSYLSTILYEVS